MYSYVYTHTCMFICISKHIYEGIYIHIYMCMAQVRRHAERAMYARIEQ